MSTVNLVLEQATTFNVSIQLINSSSNAINLSGYTGNSEIKRAYSSLNAVASFDVTLNATAGYVILSMNAATSANVPYGRYVYDVLLTDGSGNVSKVLNGILTVNPTVTIANTNEGDGDI